MVVGADGEGYAGSHEMGRLCSEWQSVGLLSRRVLTTLRMVISNGPFCLALTTRATDGLAGGPLLPRHHVDGAARWCRR